MMNVPDLIVVSTCIWSSTITISASFPMLKLPFAYQY